MHIAIFHESANIAQHIIGSASNAADAGKAVREAIAARSGEHGTIGIIWPDDSRTIAHF